MSKIVIYTDGGARGNPGPSGVGAVIFDGDENGTVLAEISEFLGHQTNNYAEYEAIVLALEKCIALGLTERPVELRADSKLAVEQLSGRWKVKDASIREQYNKVQTLLDSFAQISFTHVRRELNKHADMLANRAMDAHI
jgi:ribonuclease HI